MSENGEELYLAMDPEGSLQDSTKKKQPALAYAFSVAHLANNNKAIIVKNAANVPKGKKVYVQFPQDLSSDTLPTVELKKQNLGSDEKFKFTQAGTGTKCGNESGNEFELEFELEFENEFELESGNEFESESRCPCTCILI